MKQAFYKPGFVLAFFSMCFFQHLTAQTAAVVLPSSKVLPGWEASYDAMAYEGEDLFFLINGGADLYMEYGFLDVAAVELKHPEKGSVYIELYKMDSDSAAFGIFSLRKGNLLAEVNPAPWVAYGDDFLHVWQGPFYMSVSGGRLERNARLQVFALIIGHLTENAPAENRLPLMFEQNRPSDLRNASYIMGPLALANVYNFGHENPFRVSEAMVLEKETHREMVFFYPDQQAASETFSAVAQFMEGAGRFSQFSGGVGSFTAKDRQNNQISVRLYESQIIVELRKL